MPKILFLSNNLNSNELDKHRSLIETISSNSLRAPKSKLLKGVDYDGKPVYRVKIGKKARFVYTIVTHEGVETILVLSLLEDHDYDRLKRQLDVSENSIKNYSVYDEDEDDSIPDNELEQNKQGDEEEQKRSGSPLVFVPVVSYNNMPIELDKSQSDATHMLPPLIMQGPPGSGKTAVLYTTMLNILSQQMTPDVGDSKENSSSMNDARKSPSVWFVSASKQLVNTLQANHEMTSGVPVRFTTWNDLLLHEYRPRTLVAEKDFIEWSNNTFPKESWRIVHYEMSLLAALGEKKYWELGDRQSHFSRNDKMRQLIFKALAQWQKYLDGHGLIDPMINRLPDSNDRAIIFCDEAQNLPPVALHSLITRAAGPNFIASLDSQQCLLTSPFILSCLKVLLFEHYKKACNEHLLHGSWRCPRLVIEVANRVINVQYNRDNQQQRRLYSSVKSIHESEGVVSWVDDKHLAQLKGYGAYADTVVIVTHEPTLEERCEINTQLGSNNILTAEQAIGLDFSVVILWRPIAKQSPLSALGKGELTLEQWHGFNALYVGLTRSKSAVFICEQRVTALGKELFGDVPLNQTFVPVKHSTPEEQKKEWARQIEHHVAAGRDEIAKQLMHFYLKMDDKAVVQYFNKVRPQKQTEIGQNTSNSSPSSCLPSQSAPVMNKTLPRPQVVSPNRQQKVRSAASVSSSSSSIVASKATNTLQSNQSISASKKLLSNLIYIEKLLANPIKQNIETLFKDKNAIQLLFLTPLQKEGCLFEKLLQKNKSCDVVIEAALQHFDKVSPYITAELLNKAPTHTTVNNSMFALLSGQAKGRSLLKLLLQDKAQSDIVQKISTEALCCVHPKPTGIPPFYWLAGNIYSQPLLESLFQQNPGLARHITADALYRVHQGHSSAFYLLAASPEGRKTLALLYQINPSLAQKIGPNVLNQTDKNFAGIPVFYWLAYEKNQSILITLLDYNPDLELTITAKALFDLCPNEAGDYLRNTSAFYWLCPTNIGRGILSRLFKKNLKLAQQVTADALFVTRSSEVGGDANTSSIYWLSSSTGGLAILKMIFELNPKLEEMISPGALYLARPVNSGLFACTSTLYFLAVYPEGKTLLVKLLEKNPKVAQHPSADVLFLMRLEAAGNYAYSSAFKLLTSTSDGLTALEMLFKNNSKLLTHNTVIDALCATPMIEKEHIAKCSTLYRLSVSLSGRKTLLNLFKANPQLPKKIIAEDLCRIRPLRALQDQGASPLYWLAGCDKGRAILALLLEQNSEFARYIRAEALCQLRPPSAGIYANTSPLYFLSYTKDGSIILSTLLKDNPLLAEYISAEALLSKRSPEAGVEAGSYSLYLLAYQPFGMRILKTLFKKNPLLIENIVSIGAFSQPLEKEITKNTTYNSIFYLFAGNSDGRDILRDLFERNPKLALRVSAKALCQMRPKTEGANAGISALYSLSGCSIGHIILTILFNNNPQLIEDLNTKVLCQMRSAKWRHAAGTSALYWLAAHTRGRAILAMLLEKNPKIAQYISAKALCQTRSKAAGLFAGISAFHCLAAYRDGRFILSTLFKLNPKLASEITAEALCNKLPEETGLYAGCSALSSLAANADGRSILDTMLRLCPDLMQKITRLKEETSKVEYGKASAFRLLETIPEDNEPQASSLTTNYSNSLISSQGFFSTAPSKFPCDLDSKSYTVGVATTISVTPQ